MLTLIGSGNITRDAQLRQVGDQQVCSFGIAHNRKVKGEEKVQFIDCSIWGKRGESLAQYLTKGKKVFLTGELDTREHEGKFYLQCRVNELDFGGGPAGSASANDKGANSGSNGDDIPF